MTSPLNEKLSVIIPTYNCRSLLERHLKHLQTWIDLAFEVIVVDSQSTDGTRLYLEQNIQHPRVRFIDRERGLYESWNEGISATSGDWIYISTAGDTIERKHLLKMIEQGKKAQADVVISPCFFVDEEGHILAGSRRSNPALLREWGGKPFYLKSPSAKYFVYQGAGIQSLLGSCASDIFRGDFLRSRPFPVNYHTHGDVAWIMRYAHEMTLCVVPEVGSTYCQHVRSEPVLQKINQKDYDRMYESEKDAGPFSPYFQLCHQLRQKKQRRKEWRSTLTLLEKLEHFFSSRWKRYELTWLRQRELRQLGQYRVNLD